jgi:ATP-dependent Clp protease adaptor protein ClpS
MVHAFKFLGMIVAVTTGASVALSPFSATLRPSSVSLWGAATPAVPDRQPLIMARSTIERETIKKSGGPAVLDRPETERKTRTDDPVKERKDAGGKAWEVRIYNDGLNTREHVARSLVQVTGMSESDAYNTMMQAHQNGIAVVGVWVYEIAEMYHDALRKQGILCDLVPVDEDGA